MSATYHRLIFHSSQLSVFLSITANVCAGAVSGLCVPPSDKKKNNDSARIPLK